MREAAFSLIGPVADATVLDLFAGTGAMGLEALSRGARRAVFVERDRDACRVISQNLERLRLTAGVVVRGDALGVLREERALGRTYDLVLVDTPYDDWPRYAEPLGELVPAVLAEDGVAVVETSTSVEPELPLDLVTTRRYGSARITVYRTP